KWAARRARRAIFAAVGDAADAVEKTATGVDAASVPSRLEANRVRRGALKLPAKCGTNLAMKIEETKREAKEEK
ncbi:MAG: hypothetical protein WCB11_06290, partial [Terriglobales bacterium]